jgi:hypothetical protein
MCSQLTGMDIVSSKHMAALDGNLYEEGNTDVEIDEAEVLMMAISW